ncbi:RNA recognition motif domain-containing protein [Colwellia ponticola]|uniref:RNA-binding protein n=1 Tax=Colwellia ponticola TaxID=2304625 RepID=A0A8H2PM38_9GAMM|nr:RNA-binding protein [Colwellia ponticola]RGP39625.1 Embryonic polyadenylate-binding protein 2-A [Altererythrobacter insulae]TMM45604.1 RNA-binding protein [Colwellia ponticola]
MKSPTLQTVVIAIVFTIIAYIVTFVVAVNSVTIASLVFISAFLAPLFTGNASVNTLSSTSTSSASKATASDEEVRTLYVGNLPYRANETSVRELFAEYGSVHSVRLMKDKHTGKRRGFGFVEMAATDLDKAIVALNDTEFQQRTLKVREAKERPERPEESTQD